MSQPAQGKLRGAPWRTRSLGPSRYASAADSGQHSRCPLGRYSLVPTALLNPPLIVATAYSVRAAMMVPDEDGTGRRSRAYPAVRSNSEARWPAANGQGLRRRLQISWNREKEREVETEEGEVGRRKRRGILVSMARPPLSTGKPPWLR